MSCRFACAVLATAWLAGPPAGAQVPDASAWPDAGQPSTPIDRDAGPATEVVIDPSCPADEIRQEKSAAAAKLRLAREAADVAKRSIESAHVAARAWFDQKEQAWEKRSTSVALTELRTQLAAHVGNPIAFPRRTCVALAGGDLAACDRLPEDATVCRQLWALRSVRGPAGGACETLAEGLRGACARLQGGVCPTGDAFCARLEGAFDAAPAACGGGDPEPSHCVWTLLARVLRDGRAACDLVAPGPGRHTAAHRAMNDLCLAFAVGEPDRCPGTLLTHQAAPRQEKHLGQTVATAAFGGVPHPRALALVHTDTPAVCRVDVRVLARGVEVASAVEVRRLRSWEPSVTRVPLSGAVDAREARVAARLMCVPTVSW